MAVDVLEIREQNKDNPNYPSIYWSNNGLLNVKIGSVEAYDITPDEAYKRFKDNDFFIVELSDLLSKKSKNPFKSKELQKLDDSIVEDNISIDKLKVAIESKLDEIIGKLGLEKYNDAMTQLKNCCLIQKYIVENNKLDLNNIQKEDGYSDEDNAVLELYNAVVKHRGFPTSNALMFKKLAEKVGEKAEVVGLTSKENGAVHAANLVELDDENYFFDSTLESTIYDSNKDKTNGELILCCAGLGLETYSEYYSPNVILPDSPLDTVKPLPENISEHDIPGDIVNSMIAQTNMG